MLRLPTIIAGLLTAVSTLLCGAEAAVSDFPFVKDVRMPSAAARSGHGAEIPLDAEFFDSVEHPGRECRVFTASGAEVPFTEMRRKGVVRRTRVIPVEAVLAMTGESSGVIRIPGGLASPGPLRLVLEPENRYYAKFVRIAAKLPSGEVRNVLDRAAVYSFASPEAARDTVDFFAPAGAELTVSWTPGGDIPQKMLRSDETIPEAWSEPELVNVRIRLFRVESYREETELVCRHHPEIRVDPREKETVVSFASRRVPLTGFRLTTRTPFLIRPVRVYGGSGPEDLQLLAEGTLARLRPNAELAIAIPESRCRYYELRIDDRGKSPLDDIALEAVGPQMVLATVPPEEASLKLAFGRRIRLADMPERLPDARALCTVSARRRNPEYEPPVVDWEPETWLSVCGCGLLLLGAALGVFAFFRGRSEGSVCV